MLADDLNIKELTVKAKLKVAVASSYAANNLAEANRVQSSLEEKLVLKRVKRRAKRSSLRITLREPF